MKILINNENIDFTLDGEENCLQVMDGLSSWLEPQEYFISEVSLDGKEFFIQNKSELSDFSVNEVKELAVIALDKRQMILKDLETVASYFQLFDQALKEGNRELMTDLGNQYDYIKDSLPGLLVMDGYLFDSTLTDLMNRSGVLKGEADPSLKGELIREWTHVQSLIEGRVGELSHPAEEGVKTVSTLKRLVPKLEEISLLFQTGKDREALDIIIVLSELLSKSVRILSSLMEMGRSPALPQDFISELNDILTELAQAVESGDTILTGDLAEYEIIPRIDKLESAFAQLNGEAN